MQWLAIIHAIHSLAAGIWLGGLVFTTVVVSPAYKRMNWTPAERYAVRAEVGRQYSKVARINLLALLLAAVIDWLARGWQPWAWAEIIAIVIVCALGALHGQVIAPRVGQAVRSGDATAQQRALRVTLSVSLLNLLFSAVVAVLAI